MNTQLNRQRASSVRSEFITIPDPEALVRILERANKDTFVIFDVDMVLLNTKEAIFQVPNLDLHDEIVSSMKSKYTHEEFDYLVHCALVHGLRILKL